MDYEFLLALPTLSLSITIVLFGFSVFFLVKWNNRYRTTTSSNVGLPNSSGTSSKHRSDLSHCTSPGCVRCRNYKNLVGDLPEKLETYLNQENPGQKLERLKKSVRGKRIFSTNPDSKTKGTKKTTIYEELSEPNPTVFHLLDLETKPWYERHEMCQSDMTLIDNSYATIWDEFSQVYGCLLEGYNRGWLSNTVPSGHWNVFHLFNQGVKVTANCDRCPGTTEVVEKLSSFMSGVAFGNASFSVLQAGTRITEHCGPCNMRVRCHLGLQIPQDCLMTVSNESRPWIEEGCILFDDSYSHKANHGGSEMDGDGPRIVFILDLWNPDVTEEERAAFKAILSI